MTWTTIPRWLYENDLPDDRLQELYVKAAVRKLAEVEADPESTAEQLTRAYVFLAQATQALARYRRRRRGP
jgi:hypothetical protein